MSSDQENQSGNEESEVAGLDGSNGTEFLKKSDILAALQEHETMAVSVQTNVLRLLND